MKLTLVSFLVLHFPGFLAAYNCGGGGFKSDGYTYPPGDITLQQGEDLEIYCLLNESGLKAYGENASDKMKFKRGDTYIPHERVNSSAIRIYIRNHPLTERTYYVCEFKNPGNSSVNNSSFVCHNYVTVGTPPQDVTDEMFDCIGENFENFTCTWPGPRNYVETTYSLENTPTTYPQRYRGNMNKVHKSPAACPNDTYSSREENGTVIFSCTWAFNTTPAYRHSHDEFIFTLTAKNVFGIKQWNFTRIHAKYVRPGPPEHFGVKATSPHSFRLEWDIPRNMWTFRKNLIHRINWKTDLDTQWNFGYLRTTPKNRSATYDLTNLPYAHYYYDIRVSMKSEVATDERMWSKYVSNVSLTASKLPDCPPNVTEGSFEVRGSDMLIYWKSIHKYQENGANFTYNVTMLGDDATEPVKIDKNYAKFESPPHRNLTFDIWSQNEIGKSVEKSTVFVPADKYRLKQLKLIKVDLEKGKGEFDILWGTSSDPRTKNFTLFWCASRNERPYDCDGTLHWEVLPNTATKKTLTLYPKHNTINTYQFAISASGNGASSGMRWADCTSIKGIGVKLRTHIKSVAPRSMVLQWSLECTGWADIKSFNISYCISTTPTSQDCTNDTLQQYKLIENHQQMGEGELTVDGLKPYTGYKIMVKPILEGSASQFGEPMFNNTNEDKPTQPRNLTVTYKSDKTVRIAWKKPLEENGYLADFIVLLNDVEHSKVKFDKSKMDYSTQLDNLLPRSIYKIGINACTSQIPLCTSSELNVVTDVGYPGKVNKPSVNYDGKVEATWVKPVNDTKIDLYEMEVTGAGGSDLYNIYNTTDTKQEIIECKDDKSQKVNVRIRAVNMRDDIALPGNWSEKAFFPCFIDPFVTYLIPIVTIFAIFIFVVLGYLFKKVLRKIRDMSDCPVKLPSGLAVTTLEQKDKHLDEIQTEAPLLPEKIKKTEPRNPSGETSGCCSGTESVTSSVDSSAQLSMSDSGTEQSPSLTELEPKDTNSLRLRPNVKKPDYLTMQELPASAWSKPNGYSVIGMGVPPKKTDIDSDYLPLSDISSKSSYVPMPLTQAKETIDVAKPPSSGYVPYLHQEPASKNTPYVLAGEPTALKLPSLSAFGQKDSQTSFPSSPPIQSLFPWQQQETLSTGYVVVGDSKPQKLDMGISKAAKGYIPHNLKFENAKSMKED